MEFDYRADHPEPELIGRLEWLREIRPHLSRGSWSTGAQKLARGIRTNRKFATEEDARTFVLKHLFEDLIENDRYLEASALLWHGAMFEQRPAHVTRIFNALRDHDLNILIGASGLSKTYAAAAHNAIDYLRDPANTAVKFGSVNDTNLKGNLWANLKVLIHSALFPPEVVTNEIRMRMSVKGSRPDCGVDAILFSKQVDSTGKIKGFHPKPFRLVEHPKYGWLTVVRILLDETQELPPGVESDLGSPKSTIDEVGHQMKITLTCNPVLETKWVVKIASPEGGWDEVSQLENLHDWTSPTGWHVTRLDGAKFENVKYRRTIFPGFMTLKAFNNYMVNGQPTPDYYVMGRGFPPPGRATETIVPSSHFEQAKGEPIFIGSVQNIAGNDLGFIRDRAFYAVGRYGLASGWMDWEGNEHRFPSRTTPDEFENRHVTVLDQLIEMDARDAPSATDEIKALSESLMIEPEALTMDKTGNAYGPWSTLQKNWGPVLGIHWKEKPTENKILAEDKEGANAQVTNIIGEMYWTIRRWIDPRVRGFFINPNCKHVEQLKQQLTHRQWRRKGTMIEVEDKETFVSRHQHSPDEADSVGMMIFGPRNRGFQLPAIIDESIVDRGKSKANKGVDRTSDVARGLRRSVWVEPQLRGPANGTNQQLRLPGG